MLKRPLALGFMGPPKAGKTKIMLDALLSGRFDITRTLYFDNHGSTDMYDVHQWTNAEPYGVKHLPADEPKKFIREIDTLARKFKANSYPYDVIAVDDWSEFAQAETEELLDDQGEGAMLKVYGEVGTLQRRLSRGLLPRHSHAHLFVSFWSSQEPDPQSARPLRVVDGQVKYTQDTRPTKLRPFLKGAFAGWLPYKLDGLFYQYMEEIRTDPKRKGELEFYLQLTPDKNAAVLSRWIDHFQIAPEKGGRARIIEDPSMDKLLDLFEELDQITKSKEVN